VLVCWVFWCWGRLEVFFWLFGFFFVFYFCVFFFFFFFFAVSWREMNCVWLGDWDQIEFFTAVFCALGYYTWDEDEERGITEEEGEEAKWGQDGVKEIACLL